MSAIIENNPLRRTFAAGEQAMNDPNLMLAGDTMTVEQPLLHRVASGEQNAIEECLSKFGGLIWSLARKHFPQNSPSSGSGTGSAEDAVQEIILDVWKNANRFNPQIATETTFIAMIARRRIIDMKRKISRRPVTVPASGTEQEDGTSFIDSQPDEETVANSPTMPAELKDEVDRVRAVIDDKLDEAQREVVLLSISEQFSHREISERLNMPLGTVKTRIRRGLETIREELGVTKVKQTAKGGEA